MEEIDGAVFYGALHSIIESKDTSEPKNVESIAKLRNQLLRRPGGTIGMIFSRSGFTKPAKELAQFIFPQTILFWEGDEIRLALEKGRLCEFMAMKYRYAVQYGLNDFNIQAVEES